MENLEQGGIAAAIQAFRPEFFITIQVHSAMSKIALTIRPVARCFLERPQFA